jgi:predicted metal-dependent hydrolase
MTERGQVRFGNSTITYTVNRSSRRKKTIEITLDGHAGVLVAAPEATPADDIAAIVSKRADWIVRKSTAAALNRHPRQFVSGETLPYLGRRVRLYVSKADLRRAEVHFRHWHFEVLVPSNMKESIRHDSIRYAFQRWYRSRAKERLREEVRRWSRLLGLRPADVLIRDQRQRWASCAPDGTLRFNWRVIMAEAALIDYVVLHELAHLSVKGHSAEFWALVASVMPDYASRRNRLREVGPYLSL